MAPMSLPPGFRFHPTDEELVAYYLDRKITGRTIELEIIPEVDLYKCEPWDLPEKSFIPSNDLEWYFYSPRDKKYPNGSRTNRATRAGYWKATGKDRPVNSNKRAVGMKKTLVYYKGRAPHGIRTNWVMHEYRLMDSLCGTASSTLKDSYALCRVFKKTVQPPKTKEEKNSSPGDQDQLTVGDHEANMVRLDDQELMHGGGDANFNREIQNYRKFPMSTETTSSSDVTQGTPIGSSNTAIMDDLQPPFASSDEANSSTHHIYSSGVDFPSGPIEDLGMPSYTNWNQQLQYPPLEMEDFPQINITEMNTLISKPYDHHHEYYMTNTTSYNNNNTYNDSLNGTLEEIFLLCSSQDNNNNNNSTNDLMNMAD